jgi:hypothetical protein
MSSRRGCGRQSPALSFEPFSLARAYLFAGVLVFDVGFSSRLATSLAKFQPCLSQLPFLRLGDVVFLQERAEGCRLVMGTSRSSCWFGQRGPSRRRSSAAGGGAGTAQVHVPRAYGVWIRTPQVRQVSGASDGSGASETSDEPTGVHLRLLRRAPPSSPPKQPGALPSGVCLSPSDCALGAQSVGGAPARPLRADRRDPRLEAAPSTR